MVDRYQNDPWPTEGHAWLQVSRWGMCWRVTVATAFVGMLGILLLGLMGLADSNRVNIFFGPTGILFGLVPAPIFGVLAALSGRWLKQYHPLPQALIFGLIGAAACAVLMFIIDGVQSIIHHCPPDTGCFEPFSGAAVVAMFAGVPLALMAGGGLAITIHTSHSRSAAKIFAGLLVVTAVVFASAQFAGLFRMFPAQQFEEPLGPVCEMMRDGVAYEVECEQF